MDGKWTFTDPDTENAPGASWFVPYPTSVQVPRTANHSIYAASWAAPAALSAALYPNQTPAANAGSHYPMVWDWGNRGVRAWDVTLDYLKK